MTKPTTIRNDTAIFLLNLNLPLITILNRSTNPIPSMTIISAWSLCIPLLLLLSSSPISPVAAAVVPEGGGSQLDIGSTPSALGSHGDGEDEDDDGGSPWPYFPRSIVTTLLALVCVLIPASYAFVRWRKDNDGNEDESASASGEGTAAVEGQQTRMRVQ